MMKVRRLHIAVAMLILCCLFNSCGKDPGSIYGIVTDFSSNEPVAGANVQLRPSGKTTQTGSDGRYEFLEVPVGSYSITVSKSGYTDLVDDYEIVVSSGNRTPRDVQIKPLPASLHIYDNDSHEISELDFGADAGMTHKTFNIFNGGGKEIKYTITKSAEWITSVNPTTGTIGVGATYPIVVTINRGLLAAGDNSTSLLVTSSAEGGKELVIKAKKNVETPTVSIFEPIAIDKVTYRVKCEVVNDGGLKVTERGICWNTYGDPTMDDETIPYTSGGTGQYTIRMEHLTMATHYYVKAYAKNEYGTGLSEVLEFETGSDKPKVTTATVTDVTSTTAKAGGEITDGGGSAVTERGVCWSTSHNPTTSGSHATSGMDSNAFTVNITGLTPSTTYYVKAYAKNSAGTGYGSEVSFITETLPVYTVSVSAEPSNGGTVTGGGSYQQGKNCTVKATPATGYEFVNWTKDGEQVSTIANYTFQVTGNSTLVAHFTNVPIGSIDALFSVGSNDSDKVYFSQGNLQYVGSSNTWKFADNQWDVIGESQGNDQQGTTRDLFGWGTSGYNHGANCYQPWSTIHDHEDYYAYGNYTYNLYDQNGRADWGYNAITNGGNRENSGWRTLTKDEWEYVFNTRTTISGIRYAKACVNGVNGVILVPDDWRSSSFTLHSTNTEDANFTTNTINETTWNMYLAPFGCVFLPAAGGRDETSVDYVGSGGYYWSASSHGWDACGAAFNSDLVVVDRLPRHVGFSVRLVRSAQ